MKRSWLGEINSSEEVDKKKTPGKKEEEPPPPAVINLESEMVTNKKKFENKCKLCKVTCTSIESWYDHLISRGHQDVVPSVFPPFGKWTRTIVGWEFNDSLAKFPKKILDIVAEGGQIDDIYFRTVVVTPEEIPSVVAVQALMASREDAERFVDKWNDQTNSLTAMVDLKLGFEPKLPAKFSTLETIHYGPWCRDIERYEKGLKEDVRHELLLKKLASAPTEQHLEVFMNLISLSEKDKELRVRTIDNLERFIQKFYRTAKLHPFGSYLTGLGSPESDIDICLNANEEMLKRGLKREEVMKRLHEEILRATDNKKMRMFTCVLYIKSARIPIIRLVDASTGIQVDLSLSSPISIFNSRLIKFYLDFDPLVKPVMMLLKYWATYHGLIDSQKIKTYGLNLMTIVYLNQVKIVPRISYLQEEKLCPKKLIIDGCNVAFCDDINLVRESVEELKSKPPNTVDLKTVLSLVAGFFKFYGSQDLDENFICSLHGTPVNKSILNDQNEFFDYLGAQTEISKLFSGGPLTIEDPFVLDVNVNNPGPNLVYRFQRLCQDAFNKLSANLKPGRTISLLDLFPNE